MMPGGFKACLPALALLAGLVLAAGGDTLNPVAIRAELRHLRTRYTENHPDVQLLERRLEKALELQRRRERMRKAPQGPESNHSGPEQ